MISEIKEGISVLSKGFMQETFFVFVCNCIKSNNVFADRRPEKKAYVSRR